jgi:hypothetical protein
MKGRGLLLSKLFKCGGCGKISTAKSWNTATEGNTKWLLTPIEVNPRAHFICPQCGEWQLSANAPTEIDYSTVLKDVILKGVMEPVVITADMIPKEEGASKTSELSEQEAFPTMFNFDIDASWAAVEATIRHIVKKPCPHVGVLRKQWEAAKKPMLEVMGPTGRIAVPIQQCDSEDTDLKYFTLHTVSGYLEQAARNGSIEAGEYHLMRRLIDIMVTDNLIDISEVQYNRVLTPRNDPRREGKKIQVGTKLNVYLQIVLANVIEQINVFDRDVRGNSKEVIRQKIITHVLDGFSQVMNTITKSKPETHYLVLSCNPLDMLLSSDSTNGWNSCHRLEGGYATGGLAYMLDDVSLIAYVYKNVRQYAPCSVELPIKSWRQMVYLDVENKAAIMSREYPGLKSALGKASRRLVARVLADLTGCEYKWKVARLNTNATMPENPDDNGDYCVDRKGIWQYRDIPTYRIRMQGGGTPKVYTGLRYLPCPVCGKQRDDGDQARLACPSCIGIKRCHICGSQYDLRFVDETSTQLICTRCLRDQETVECASCNETIRRGQAEILPDGTLYCADCFHDNYFRCYSCEGTYALEDSNSVDGFLYCSDCYEEMFFDCPMCGEIVSSDYHRVVTVEGNSYCTTCAENNFEVCNDCDEYTEHPLTALDEDDDAVHYCETCFRRSASMCSVCGEAYTNNALVDGMCSSCREDAANEEGESLCSIA